jgi:hypothetical protein
MNNELERISRKILPGGSKENNENFRHDSRFSGQDLKQRSPGYEAGALTTAPLLLVWRYDVFKF